VPCTTTEVRGRTKLVSATHHPRDCIAPTTRIESGRTLKWSRDPRKRSQRQGFYRVRCFKSKPRSPEKRSRADAVPATRTRAMHRLESRSRLPPTSMRTTAGRKRIPIRARTYRIAKPLIPRSTASRQRRRRTHPFICRGMWLLLSSPGTQRQGISCLVILRASRAHVPTRFTMMGVASEKPAQPSIGRVL